MNEEYYTLEAKQHKFYNILADYIQSATLEDPSNIDDLIGNLIYCAMIHKHEGFSSEQEIRIAPFFIKQNDTHIQFKIGKTIKRVYALDLEELCKKENMSIEDLIDSIVIAPNSKQNVEDLKLYFITIGLEKIAGKVNKSNCPLK